LRFSAAVFAGRLVRYSLVAYLAAKFGDRAAEILKNQYPTVSLAMIGCVLLVILIRTLKNRRKQTVTSS
jgi:hypothetical protein